MAGKRIEIAWEPFLLLLVFTLLFYKPAAMARPVAYENATSLVSINRADKVELAGLYSLTHRLAFGAQYVWLDEQPEASQFVLSRLNILVYRWFGDDFQANLYASGGVGVGYSDSETDPAYLGELRADFETRRWFLLAEGRLLGAPDVEEFNTVAGRVGYAPYLADFKSLQTWLMLQVRYEPQSQKEVRVTPLLRFFYRNLLWEIGASLRGDWLLNIILEV